MIRITLWNAADSGFHQVAKLGSFTKAAAATYRTQSALSQQVKALEEKLGGRLLERLGKRRLKLPPPEKSSLICPGVPDPWDRLQEEVQALQGHPRGPLSLAAPFTTLYHLLPDPGRPTSADYPQVELTLLDRDQAGVFALVKDGDIDFGLALASLVPKDLAAIPWQPLDTVLMAPPDHPLARAAGSPGGRSPAIP